MKKLIITSALLFTFACLFGQADKGSIQEKEQESSPLPERQLTEDEFGLVVNFGGINGSDGTGGYGLFGSSTGGHINIDNNEIQAKNSIGASWGTLYLNYWGGTTDIGYGSTGNSNVNIGVRSGNGGFLNAYNTLYVDGGSDQVGIGTSLPNTSLHIEQTGAGGIYIEGNGTGDARLQISNTTGNHYLFDDDSDSGTFKIESANDFAINTNGVNERLRIDEEGRMAVNRPIASATQLYVETEGYSWALFGDNGKSTSTNYGVYGQANGSGTTSRYGVYGTASTSTGNRYAVFGTATTTGTNSWAGYFSGDLYYTGTFQAPSDERLKKNVKDMPSMLDKVMELSPKTYEFKTTEYDYVNLAQGSQFGFLSQEIENQFPELVSETSHVYQTGEAGIGERTEQSVDIKSLDYVSLIPILTKAIQEQQAQIENLQTQLTTYEDLEKRMAAMEAQMKK